MMRAFHQFLVPGEMPVAGLVEEEESLLKKTGSQTFAEGIGPVVIVEGLYAEYVASGLRERY
jgi:hypothetical protein